MKQGDKMRQEMKWDDSRQGDKKRWKKRRDKMRK